MNELILKPNGIYNTVDLNKSHINPEIFMKF